jgi:hypothetical protein
MAAVAQRSRRQYLSDFPGATTVEEADLPIPKNCLGVRGTSTRGAASLSRQHKRRPREA